MDSMTRRELMTQASGIAMAAGLPPGVAEILTTHFNKQGQAFLVPAEKGFSPDWIARLTERTSPDVTQDLKYIGMPVGGIACGQVYLAGDGRLWHWDVFHQSGWGDSGGGHYEHPVAVESPIHQGFRIELEGKTHELPEGAADVEFETRYPVGVVRYRYPKLDIELEAFSPFIPLETDDSCMPITVMRYTLRNTGAEVLKGSIDGYLKNPVGDFLGYGPRMVKKTRAETRDDFALLEHYAEPKSHPHRAQRPDIMYADFEGDTYAPWTVEGDAFGTRPYRYDELPDRLKGITPHGKSFVNSHEARHGEKSPQSDSYVGKLTSPEFKIERGFINFWIGGGNHPDLECINLVIDGKVERTATGRNSIETRHTFFDVTDLEGKTAHIEIVDNYRGGWGHITIDDIQFSDKPAEEVAIESVADFGSMCLGLLGKGSVGEDSVLAPFELQPGESTTLTFFLTWYFPNLTDAADMLGELKDYPKIKRHYAKLYRSAGDVARDFHARAEHLVGKTLEFANTWYDSTLPHWFLARTLIPVDCMATATTYRFDDGRFYAWEGVYCCAGTCQHVWNYAQAAARLFPDLERHTREFTDYGIAYQPDGTMWYRAEYDHRMAHDGQAGTIIRTFREHTMTPDTAWIAKIWPRVKQSIRRLMQEDSNHDGILDTWQYNTLDDAWAGKISWISSMYLAALRCGAEMARDLKDTAFAEELEARVAKGSKSVMEQLYDGEIFVMKRDPRHPESTATGPGCHIDQVFGDSLLHQVGLDPVLPRPAVKGALKALFKYNFAPDAGGYHNKMQAVLRGGRWYAMPGEAGLVMTTFPKGGAAAAKGVGRESVFIGYFNECMNGFEYQAAAHMIAEGLLTEGLAVIRTLHDRYGPSKRNPYNEIECSDHYSRSMAAYGAFLTMCGFRWYGPRRHLAFAPRLPGDFRAPFVTSDGWGTFSMDSNGAKLTVRHGRLRMKTLDLPMSSIRSVTVGSESVAFRSETMGGGTRTTLNHEVVVSEGETFAISA